MNPVYTADDVRRILHPSSTESRADTAAGVDSEVVRRLRAMLGVDDDTPLLDGAA